MQRLTTIFIFTIYLVACTSTGYSPERLNWAGNEAYFQHDYDRAMEWYSASLEESIRTGNKQYEAISIYGLARASGHLCKLDEAERWLVKSTELRKSLPNLETAFRSQNTLELGRLYIAKGEWEKAYDQFSQGLTMLEDFDMGNRDPLGYANLLDEYHLILKNTGQHELASSTLALSSDLRKHNQDARAQYVSDPYPENCPLNTYEPTACQ